MKFFIASQNQYLLADEVEKAQGFLRRLVGLIGRKKLAPNAGLWIPACNSVHTFFMKFPIDLIFLDKNLKVCALYSKLAPWRITKIIWKANSVLELSAGAIERSALKLGDQLHVVS